MQREYEQKGFTLIEMIVVLVLVGIMAAVAGIGLVTTVNGYLFAKDNATVSAKTQIAMARITKELQECYDCKGTAGAISSPFTFKNNLGSRTITWNGSNISINARPLMENVSFSMNYNTDKKSITVTITSSVTPGGVALQGFTTTVYPRNII